MNVHVFRDDLHWGTRDAEVDVKRRGGGIDDENHTSERRICLSGCDALVMKTIGRIVFD
jgi:hypothetical protein